jgi:hypothetical protein
LRAVSETILVAEQLKDGSGAIASARSRAATSMKFATRGFGYSSENIAGYTLEISP